MGEWFFFARAPCIRIFVQLERQGIYTYKVYRTYECIFTKEDGVIPGKLRETCQSQRGNKFASTRAKSSAPHIFGPYWGAHLVRW